LNQQEKHALSERHYPALDGLRGIAALMIVWYHFLVFSPVHGKALSFLSEVSGFGWAGVDLFFALSGFLITGILADSRAKKHYIRTFYARRVLRIFPLYYGFLVIVFFILPIFTTAANVPNSLRIFFWTYTGNLFFVFNGRETPDIVGHLWTLAIEEQFYLVWPLVIFFASSIERLRIGLLWAFVLVSVLRCVLFFAGVDFTVLYRTTLTHCDALILGGYLALSVRSSKPGSLRGLRPNMLAAFIIIALALFLTNYDGINLEFSAPPIVMFGREVLMFGLLAIIFVWLIHAATHQTSSRISQLFSSPVLRWFGKYSYALYILHLPIAILLFRSDISWLTSQAKLAQLELFSIYFGCSILSAFLSWHLYEKHFLKFKRYFPYVRAV
jgi:peptidoglycan/LPS O-acetylase OafA/YrhL